MQKERLQPYYLYIALLFTTCLAFGITIRCLFFSKEEETISSLQREYNKKGRIALSLFFEDGVFVKNRVSHKERIEELRKKKGSYYLTYILNKPYQGKTLFYQALEKKDLYTVAFLLGVTIEGKFLNLKIGNILRDYLHHHPKGELHPMKLLTDMIDKENFDNEIKQMLKEVREEMAKVDGSRDVEAVSENEVQKFKNELIDTILSSTFLYELDGEGRQILKEWSEKEERQFPYWLV